MTTIGQIARLIARELRKNPTHAEKIFWSKIRKRQFRGLRFNFQHPIFYIDNNRKRFFIVDFYCHQLRLTIEIDGEIHLQQKEYDICRMDILNNRKIQVIRFKNEEIINDINKLLIQLNKQIENLLPIPQPPFLTIKGKG